MLVSGLEIPIHDRPSVARCSWVRYQSKRNGYRTKRKRMVVSGAFVASVVDAKDNTALKERTDAGGTVWVKGDPGDEFFVTIGQLFDLGHTVTAHIEVDGKDLGYSMVWHRAPFVSDPLGPAKSGQSWRDGDMVSHAFQFMRHVASHSSTHDEEGRRAPAAGCVTVTFYRATVSADQTETETESTSEWTGSTEAVVASHKKEQASLRAGVGSAPGRVPRATAMFYDCHETLSTITIRYTTDFGIAVRGLYTHEEVNMPPSPPNKKVKREAGGTSKDDAIVV